MNARPSIILIGLKSSGKTTVGRLVARKLGLRFTDVDAEVERRYCEQTGEKLHFREIFKRHGGSPREVDELLDAGEAQVARVIPRGFAADLAAERTARVQLLIDGSDSMTAAMVAGYASGIAGEYSTRVAAERLERLRARVQRVPAVEQRTRVWFNPELRSVRYMVPGVFSMILFLVTMLLTSMAIVKEREIGTLEQLVVTPISPAKLVVGKTLPYIAIGFVDMLLVLALATFWFDVPVAGSVALLFALSLVFIFTSLGLGVFISTVSHTQQQAMMMTFFIMLPSILLSGFIFPIANMPAVQNDTSNSQFKRVTMVSHPSRRRRAVTYGPSSARGNRPTGRPTHKD